MMTDFRLFNLTSLALILVSSYAHSAGTETANNTFLGSGAGNSLGGSAVDNTLIGVNAGSSVSTGDQNTFVGDSAGENNTASFNTFVGAFSGRDNTSGSNNTFVGVEAGKVNTSGGNNTFIGEDAGVANTSGSTNTFIGVDSGLSNTSGGNNTFVGEQAGQSNTTGRRNTYLGEEAGRDNTTGEDNTFIGENAGRNNTSGSGNVFLGSDAGRLEVGSNKLHIDNDGSTPLIYGEFDTNIVGINGSLGVGTEMPTATLHVRRNDGSAALVVEEASPTTTPRTLLNLQNKGRPEIVMGNTGTNGEWSFGAGTNFILKQGTVGTTSAAKTKLLTLFAGTGDLEISGSIITGGPSCSGGCDAVLTDSYQLPSIQEHAAEMMAMGHLPNVGPTVPYAPLDLSEQYGRLLNELEHAHIYIAQLEKGFSQQQTVLTQLLERIDRLESVRSE